MMDVSLGTYECPSTTSESTESAATLGRSYHSYGRCLFKFDDVHPTDGRGGKLERYDTGNFETTPFIS